MEAHARLSNKGFNVASFGTGDKVREETIAFKIKYYSFLITY